MSLEKIEGICFDVSMYQYLATEFKTFLVPERFLLVGETANNPVGVVCCEQTACTKSDSVEETFVVSSCELDPGEGTSQCKCLDSGLHSSQSSSS